MSRTKNFMYNSMATAIYQIIVMLSGFITPRILLQFYGSEMNGLVSSINQFITYFSLVEAGIAGAAVYSLYKPLAEKNNDGISAIVSAAKKFYIQAGWIFTILVIGMAVIYPAFVKATDLSFVAEMILIVILGAKGFLEFFTLAKYRVILTADQKTYIISNASSVYIILQMVIIVTLSLLKVNITIVYGVAILALFARSFILMIYVKKHYKYINYKAKPNVKALDQRWDALFLQVLQAVQTGAPVILATVFTTLQEVSVYTVFNMVFAGINGVLNIFVNGLSAGFGDVIVRKEKDTLQKTYREFEYSYYMIITVVYAVTAIMIIPFVNIYTSGIHDANYNQPILGILFTLNGLLYNLKTPQGMLVISAGLYKETRVQTSIQALIIVVGGIILAPSLGLVGILIASCLSNLYRDIDLLFFIPKNVTKLPAKDSLYRILRVVLISVILYIPFIKIFNINSNGYLQWIEQAVVVTLGISAITLLVNFLIEKKQFKNVLERIKSLVKF